MDLILSNNLTHNAFGIVLLLKLSAESVQPLHLNTKIELHRERGEPHSNKNHQSEEMRIAISTEKILNYIISQRTGGCAGKIRALAAHCLKSLQLNSSVNCTRCVFSAMASFF